MSDNSKKRPTNDEDQSRDSKHPRIVVDDSFDGMNIDDTVTEIGSFQSPSPTPSLSPSPSYPLLQGYPNTTIQDESNELDKLVDNVNMGLIVTDRTINITGQVLSVTDTAMKRVSSIANCFEAFAPSISTFFNIGNEIILLYKKAEHHKELCGFLLKRCNFAKAAVQDLDLRRTENAAFFSKEENLTLFKEFVDCTKRIRTFIAEVSQLQGLKKYSNANSIQEKFTKLMNESEAYMTSLNFSFIIQPKEELLIIKNDIKEIKEILSFYGIPNDEQSQQEFFDKTSLITEKNRQFQRENKRNKLLYSSEHKILDENEPLLDGNEYLKTNVCPSKRIEKRTSLNEFCFKEFPNNPPSLSEQSNSEETQVEIRRQVNILKELKNSDHIIRFYGVSYEDSKFYLVTEWMEHGNLHEYYTKLGDTITWKTKIKFALDICRGVAYLHECRILHRDIQSTNILVNEDHKVRIANFGLSRKFSDITRNISHNLENIRYMAPEKLNKDVSKKKAYDSKCEIYSVGTLLWEIAELKKPHSDLEKSEAIVKIRKRIEERYSLPFSDDVPYEWKYTVSKAMEHEPTWRNSISDICRDFYNLSKSMITAKDAIIEHNSKESESTFQHDSICISKAKQWIDYNIQQRNIKSIPWSEFKGSSLVGSGSFGSVFKAFWQSSHCYVAYKKLSILSDIQCKTWEAFKHELCMQTRAHNCENIIRILGISTNPNDEYLIVMEYADGGNLNDYLLNNFEFLDWKKKFRLALDITNGLNYLHNENILHRDLHAGNIVIHQGKAKITDFGCSKSMNTTTNLHDNLFGNIAYAAFEIIKAEEYKRGIYTKSSDAYSLGVVLWQISSGRPPFEGQNKNMLIVTVMLGHKEKRIPDTPDEYYNLYNQCWNNEPDKRPTIEHVYDVLENLLGNDKINEVNYNSEENNNGEILSDLVIRDWVR